MKFTTVGALASALALASSPGHALSFDFSFTNTSSDPRHVNGTVTGLIEGLTDNTISQQATDVIVESYPAGIVGPPPAPFLIPGTTSPLFNDFTVANGSITSAVFAIFGDQVSLCLSFANPSFTCVAAIARRARPSSVRASTLARLTARRVGKDGGGFAEFPHFSLSSSFLDRKTNSPVRFAARRSASHSPSSSRVAFQEASTCSKTTSMYSSRSSWCLSTRNSAS